MTPKVGLSFVVDPAFTHAVRPLFEDGLVQALEWDVDCMWGLGDGHRAPPAWAEDLLDAYAADGALYGHSVFQSPLGAAWQPRHAAWLDSFAIEVGRRPFRHITEHACFFTGGPFVLGPMLPAPPVDATVALGRERLYAMAAIAKCPIGLENLAGALGTADVVAQGALLDAMVAPLDGVLVLDVHNLYVVATNLGLDPIAVLDHFPLHRVRELHVAGGQRTRPSSGPRTRLLDGHDGPVPEPVFPRGRGRLPRAARADPRPPRRRRPAPRRLPPPRPHRRGLRPAGRLHRPDPATRHRAAGHRRLARGPRRLPGHALDPARRRTQRGRGHRRPRRHPRARSAARLRRRLRRAQRRAGRRADPALGPPRPGPQRPPAQLATRRMTRRARPTRRSS
jgi:hypothetical protein